MYEDDVILQKGTDGNEVSVFDPYNPLNKLIEKEDIENLLKIYGINQEIRNIDLYRRAFVHRSYLKNQIPDSMNETLYIVPKPENCIPLCSKSNERLEYLGDGLLECVTKYYLYCRFLKKDEGFMTEKKIALVKNESIGKIAMEMGLNKWFIMSKNAETKNTRNNLKKLGCLFEAFLGALFLDFNKEDYEEDVAQDMPFFDLLFSANSGFRTVQCFIKNVFEKHIDWVELIQSDHNYKNILQVIIQKEFKLTPQYLEISKYDKETGYNMGVYLCMSNHKHQPLSLSSVKGSDNARDIQKYLAGDEVEPSKFHSFKDIHEYYAKHQRIFLLLGEGTHTTKKEAEQIACENAISYISGW